MAGLSDIAVSLASSFAPIVYEEYKRRKYGQNNNNTQPQVLIIHHYHHFVSNDSLSPIQKQQIRPWIS